MYEQNENINRERLQKGNFQQHSWRYNNGNEKFTTGVFDNRFEQEKEVVSELEGRKIEIIESEEQKERRMKKVNRLK